MFSRRLRAILLTLSVVAAPHWLLEAQTGRGGTAQPPATPVDTSVPAELKPLLAPRHSELRLVVIRYTADRATLAGNYAGAGRGGGRGDAGRGGRGDVGQGGREDAGQIRRDVPLSPARLARLKRYDVDWAAALAKIDVAKLTPQAKTDLQTLSTAVAANQSRLDADAATLARATPLVPFAPRIVQLVEARIRIEDVIPEKAAGILTQVAQEIGGMRARLEAGLSGAGDHALRVRKDDAVLGADAADNLRAMLAEWFGFYNGYDPMFTWWMGVPFKRVDTALQGYAAVLREKIAAADQAVSDAPVSAAPVAPAPAPRFNSVPDLQDIIALPQDEMTPVVQRFLAGTGARSGRGGPPAGATASAGPEFYRQWLAALQSLDFDTLTRNAQVDYLYLKRTAAARIARAAMTLTPNPPRKQDQSGIPGAARGREGLILDLQEEMIPYTPEELIALANREFAWCEEEMKKAARQMGLGDDWKKAVEKVKDTYVPPGGQPAMIRDLLFEAIDYLRAKDLITVPSVAAESLHMVMMTPQQQLTSPFFLGGSQILVSYPTDTMDYDARMQSMRGNNPGFSHATAHHEMIPGHNLAGYVGQRYGGNYRANLGAGGPFFGEGWPLSWELTLYDMGFNKTPEQRVGALFWRMHRCARIIFSLNFHMGLWSPQESIDFLVTKVGHERDNATAEVRRSFQGGYGPLYQAAYLLGGLQLRGLRRELVDTKVMTNRQFHDEVIRQGNMPIALIRLALTRQRLTRDMNIEWKFYGDLSAK